MTEIELFLKTYGPWVGFLVYIIVHDIIPFFKEKIWPSLVEEKKELSLMRRDSDARILDFEERKIVVDEQIAKNIILLTTRLEQVEKEIGNHDLRVTQAFTQITTTQTMMQSVLNVLLDRVSRYPSDAYINPK